MKTRIGLVYNPAFGRSVTKHVDADNTSELAAELAKAGAKRGVLYYRDRFGDGHTEGQPFAIAELSDTHYAWLAAPTKDGMRGLFYDTKA
jgi:hypothetical protein